MPLLESPYPDPDPFMMDGLVWVTNADAKPGSTNEAWREELTAGPPRPTVFQDGTVAKLEAAGIIGLYGQPLAPAAPPVNQNPLPAPTPPPAEKPARKAKPSTKRMQPRPAVQAGHDQDTLL